LGDPAAMLAAIQRKLVDGFVMSAPADQIVQQRGFGKPVLDAFSGALPELNGVPFAGLVTSRSQLKARPELFAAILRAMAKSIRLLQEHPDDAKALIRPYFTDMDAATFDAVMAKYLQGAAKSASVSKAQYEAALKWASIGSAKPIEVPFEAVVDNSFAEAASK
jgi:ABC-type nitrate/sulfonate/bicarbonate transport system substrate-binding protein